MKKPTSLLGVKIVGGLKEVTTAWAGVSLLVELYRKLEMGRLANKVLPAKRSSKGLTHGQTIESFILLSTLGGECIDDMKRIRDDEGLTGMLGYRPPAPETARQWLDSFHDEALLSDKPLQGSFIPAESSGLAGLREMNKQIIQAYANNLKPGMDVTLDVDTQFIETNKSNAKYCYEGYKAFQAMKVVWAEPLLVLNDEFRDGNVSARKDIGRVVDEAVNMLPPGEWRISIRSDSAAYDQHTLKHWDEQHWKFAVSADMSLNLKKEIEQLPDNVWQYRNTDKDGVVRDWAEVPFVPDRKQEKRNSRPYRYLALRMRQPQGEMFHDGAQTHHYAIVTNIWDMAGKALIEWQRGKAGSVEQVHHIIISDLAGGIFPSYKYGANAAWLRLQVITYNLLQMLKKVALPAEYADAQPKRLRFAIFTSIGKLIRHGGQTLLRLADAILSYLIRPGRRRIMLLTTG